MVKNTKQRRIFLCIVLVLILVLGSVVKGLGAINYKGQLGSNKALGSPLLNNNFTYEQWNKWELITFGIFLSNYVVPLIDDYESAFTVNELGSKGRGLEAIRFGMGEDSAAYKSLQSLLQYSITAQKNAGREIKVIYNNYENGEIVSSEEPRVATIEDLMIRSSSGIFDGLTEIANIDNSSIINSTKEVNRIEVIDKAKLGKLVVVGSGEGQHETIFDYSDGWDAQVMGAWISRLASSEHAKEINNNLAKMLEENTPLVFDNFGNICTVYGGRNIVVVPGAINQYLTATRSYNLLNSVIFNNNSYVDGSSKGILGSDLGARKSAGSSINYSYGLEVGDKRGNNSIQSGDILLYHDSLSTVSNYLGNFKGDAANKDLSKLKDGQGLSDLINSNLGGDSSKLGIRMQVVGATDSDGWFGRAFDGEIKKLSQHIAKVSNLLANRGAISNTADVLNTLTTDKGEVELFDSYVYMYALGGSMYFDALFDYIMKYADGSKAHNDSRVDMESSSAYRGKLGNISRVGDLASLIYYKDGNKKTVSDVVKSFILGEGSYLFSLPNNMSNLLDKELTYKELLDTGIKGSDGSKIDLGELINPDSSGNNLTYGSYPGRYIKLWLKNSTMNNAMNALSVKPGTEFDIWSRYIYISYLDFYGVLGKEGHKFNEHLFSSSSDMLNVKPEELFNNVFLTEDEKKSRVLDNTLLLLDVDNGREYRRNWFMNLVDDSLRDMYMDLTNGGDNGNRNNGFLTIDSYGDNPLTSWFISNYSKILIFLIGGLLIVLVCVGVIKRKSLSWGIITLVVGVNVLLFIPMLGDIVPYITNNVVQNMFSKDMTYYSMSESIANTRIEAERSLNERAGGSDSSLSTSEYIRMLNIVELDRNISAKFDISKKVLEDSNGLINDIQRLESTRWLLPTLMRQFSADDGSANYVYQSMGDIYNNLSNLYWLYDYADRLNYNTLTSGTIVEGNGNDLSLGSKRSLYDGYVDTSMDGTRSRYNGLENTTSNKQPYMDYTWNSVSRAKDDSEVVHAGYYLLDGLSVPDADGDFEALVDNPPMDRNYVVELSNKLEQSSVRYDIMDGAKSEYGYLWSTESPIYYFYNVVKDTFESGKSVGGFAGDLQGFYAVSESTGSEERNSFLHYRDTGYVRDVLDLEELFTNLVPYMYSMQVIMGGSNGTNGILGDLKITGNNIYDDNLKSWLFRSNWVTKLMENDVLTRSEYVRGTNGERYKVENPLLPSSYPAERDMVFSEAEMYARGLSKGDLTLAELKMIDINNAVADAWTLLLNYVNTPEITTEVFYRQMAVDALLVFNKEFNTDRGLFSATALYPTSLDLRNLSFDAIMKMLIVSATKNSSNIYGDAMSNVLAGGSVFSGILLLLTAWVSITLVPFMRNLLLALIFYLGMFLLVRNLIGRQKVTIIVGFLGCNTLFLVSTLVYYGIFALLVNTSNADSVLSIGSTAVNVGSADMLFVVLLVVSLVYAVAMGLLFRFIFKNAYTLGGTAIIGSIEVLKTKLSNKFRGLGKKMGNVSRGSSKGASKGTQESNIDTTKVSVNIKDSNGLGSNDRKDTNDIGMSSSWINDKRVTNKENRSKGTNILDVEIDKGKKAFKDKGQGKD